MEEFPHSWSLFKVVVVLEALRGIASISAMILSAEIGDCRRFAHGGHCGKSDPGDRVAARPVSKTQICKIMLYERALQCNKLQFIGVKPRVKTMPRRQAFATGRAGRGSRRGLRANRAADGRV